MPLKSDAPGLLRDGLGSCTRDAPLYVYKQKNPCGDWVITGTLHGGEGEFPQRGLTILSS